MPGWRFGVRLILATVVLTVCWAVAADRADAAVLTRIADETLIVKGNRASDQLALRLKAGAPTTLEVDVGDNGSADFSFDRATFDAILVRAGDGGDLVRIDEVNGVFTDTETTTLSGEGGDDRLLGGSGPETLIGGPQSDTVDGNRGADVGELGFGDDVFVWDPGDGSDVVEGDGGADVLVFNGAGTDEGFDLSANGERLRFFRDAGSITMDVDNVERVDLEALGGKDSVVVNELAGTDVTQVNVDLEGILGGGAGDGQPDTVTVNGTPAPDTIDIAANAGAVAVTGLAAAVQITHSEAINDKLIVNGLGGDDTITAGPGVDALIQLTTNQ